MVSDFINLSKYLSYLPYDTNNHNNIFALNKQQKCTSIVDLKYSGRTVKSPGKNKQSESKNIRDNLGFIINKLHKVYDNLNPVISKVNTNVLEVIIHDFDFIKYDKLSTCSLTNEQCKDILEASKLLQDLNNNFVKDAQVATTFDPWEKHSYQRNFIVNLVYETTYKNFQSLSNSFIKRETLNVLVELYNSLQSSICTLNKLIENQQIALQIPLGVTETENLLEKSKEHLKGVNRLKSDLIFSINKLKTNNKLAVLIEESESCGNSNESINVTLCKIKSEDIDEVHVISSENYVSAYNCILEKVENETSLKNPLENTPSSSISLTFGDENPSFSTHCSTCEEVIPVYTEESLTSSEAPITIIDSSCCLKSSIPFLRRSTMKSKSLSYLKASDISFLNSSLKSFLNSSLDKISLNYPKKNQTKNMKKLKERFAEPCVVISIKSQCFPSDMNKDDEIVSNKNFPSSSKSSYHSLRYTEGNLILIESVQSQHNVQSATSISRRTTVPTSGQISQQSSSNKFKNVESRSTIILNPKTENITSLTKREQPGTDEDNTNISNPLAVKKSQSHISEKSAISLVEIVNSKVLEEAHTSKSMVSIPVKYENLTLLSKRYHKQTNKSNFSIKYIKTSSDTLLVKPNPAVLPLNKNKNICMVKEMDVPYEASTTSIPKEDDLPKHMKISRKHKTRKNNLKTKQNLKKHLPYTISNTSLPREDDHYYKTKEIENQMLSKLNYYATLANVSQNVGNPSYDIYYNALKSKESFKDNVNKPYSTKQANKEVNNSDSGINSDPNNTESFTKNDLPWGLQIFEVRVVGMERNRSPSESSDRRVSGVSEISTTPSIKSKYYDYPEEPQPQRISVFQRLETGSYDYDNVITSFPRESIPLSLRPWAPLQTSDISLPREDDEGQPKKPKEKPQVTDNGAQISSIMPDIFNEAIKAHERPTTSADGADDGGNYVPFKLIPVSMIRADDLQRFSLDHEADPKMLPFILTDLNQVRPPQNQNLQLAKVSCENPNAEKSLTNASTQTDDAASSLPINTSPPGKTHVAMCSTQTQKKPTYCRGSGTDNNLNPHRTPPHPCCCTTKKNSQGVQSTPTTSTAATATCCGNCSNKNNPQNPYKNCSVYHNPNTYYSFIDVRKPKCFHRRNRKLFKNDYLNELVLASSETLLNNKIKSETQSQSLSKIHNCKFSAMDEKGIGMEGEHLGKPKTNAEKLKEVLNKNQSGLKKNVCKKKFPINSDTVLESIKRVKLQTNDKLGKLNGRLCVSDTDACTSFDGNKMKIANKYFNYMHEQEKLSKHSLLKKMMDYDNKYELKKKEAIKINSKEELELKRCPSCCNIFNKNVNTRRMDRHHNAMNTRVRVGDALNNLKINNCLGQSDLRKISCHAAPREFGQTFLKCQTLQTTPKKYSFEDCGLSMESSVEKFNLSSTVCNFPLYGYRLGNSNDNLVSDPIKRLNKTGRSKFVNHFSNSDSRLYVRVDKNYAYDNMARICCSMKGYQNDELQKICSKVKRCCKTYEKTLKQLTTKSGTNVLLNGNLDKLLKNGQGKDNGRVLTDLIALKTLAQSLLSSQNILRSSFEEALLDNLIMLTADNILKYSGGIHNNYKSKLPRNITDTIIIESLSDNEKN